MKCTVCTVFSLQCIALPSSNDRQIVSTLASFHWIKLLEKCNTLLGKDHKFVEDMRVKCVRIVFWDKACIIILKWLPSSTHWILRWLLSLKYCILSSGCSVKSIVFWGGCSGENCIRGSRLTGEAQIRITFHSVPPSSLSSSPESFLSSSDVVNLSENGVFQSFQWNGYWPDYWFLFLWD